MGADMSKTATHSSSASRQTTTRDGLDTVDAVLEAYKRGEVVVVADDAYRENEGDLIVAAEKATEDSIAFMARHGCGLVCIAMTRQRLDDLGLNRMPVRGNGEKYRTAFMESIDAREGILTGISASDRLKTVKVLINDESRPGDMVSPGHMFPLEGADGGVLERAGHTEAAIDLARLSGLKPAGIICEILEADGRMARLPALKEFAGIHELKITTVAALIAYRKQHELSVEFMRSVDFPTRHGVFQLMLYRSHTDGEDHIALVKGQPALQESALVRVHSQCLTGDVFGSDRCDCGQQVEAALKAMECEGHGVLVYMRQEGRGIGLSNKIHAYELQDRGLDTVEANHELGFSPDDRDYGVAAEILQHIGVTNVRLMTNNPMKVSGLEDHGVRVVERIPHAFPATPHNERYLKAKKEKLGHLL